MKKIVASLLTMALMIFVVPATAGPASAGTADYTYTCVSSGTVNVTWTIPKGQPLSMCQNARIYVYHNGSLVETYPTTADGAKYLPKALTAQQVWCIVAVVGATSAVVISTSGTALLAAGIGGVLGVKSECKS